MRGSMAGAVALGCVLGGACSFVFDSERQQCDGASDCAALGTPGAFVCGDDGFCVQAGDCAQDADCPGAQVCSDSFVCVECVRDAQCAEGQICSEASSCVQCETDAHCSDGELCSESSTCVQCERDADCGGGHTCRDNSCVDLAWGCVEEGYGAPAAEPNFTLTFDVLDLLTENVVTENATVEACSVNDFNCMTSARPGSFEGVTMSLPFTAVGTEGFVGFIRIQSPDFIDGYFHVLDPLVTNVVAQDRLRVFNDFTYATTAAIVGLEEAPVGAATVVVLVYDCQGNPAPDVAMIPDASPDSVFFAIENEMTPLTQDTTSLDGTAVIVNVEPGLRDIVLRHQPPGGEPKQLARLNFFARQDAVNYIHWYPTHSALMAAQVPDDSGQ